MTPENNPVTQPRPQRWYQSGSLAFGMFVMALFSLIYICAISEGDFSAKPSMLLLKPEGCLFLQQNGIAAEILETKPDHGCTLNVQYSHSSQKNSGVIVTDDKELRMADDQVAFVGSLESQPWTPKQFRWVMLITAHFLLLLGLVVRLFVLARETHIVY